jgi:coatomer subunit beta
MFWEVVPKTDAEGRLMQEMILVSHAFPIRFCTFTYCVSNLLQLTF